MIRTFSELSQLLSFEDRYRYLRMDGRVGLETFGFDRYMNQVFYKSKEWKLVRDFVIVRDQGCDLGVHGREIGGRIIIHHMNPITQMDLVSASDFLLNPEYLICTSQDTHNAIHYGADISLSGTIVERTPNDTCPWKK